MRTKLSLVTLAVLLAACQPNTSETQSTQSSASAAETQQQSAVKAQSESERINEWFAKKYEQQLQQSPMMLTFLGRKEQYNKVDVMTEEEELRQLAIQKKDVEELKANFDYNKLNDGFLTFSEHRESVNIEDLLNVGIIYSHQPKSEPQESTLL